MIERYLVDVSKSKQIFEKASDDNNQVNHNPTESDRIKLNQNQSKNKIRSLDINSIKK